MKTIYDLKPAFQGLLRPWVRALARRGVTANHVTVAACVLSILTGVLIIAHAGERPAILLLLPVVLFVRMALNAIDGMLAREHGMKSALGGFLNELGDVVSDAALYLPLAVLSGVHGFWVVLFVLLALITELAGVLGAAQGASRRYDGPMGKSDRAVVVGTLGLLLGFGVDPGGWLNALLIIVNALLLLTVSNRVRSALKEINAA